MKHVRVFKSFEKQKEIKLKDLKENPLVNIIIPAWKEGTVFKGCLLSIRKLTYPKLKVIINAGGSEETINIANSFKKYSNFTVIYQKAGKGKVKAINDCLEYVSEGIVYFIDADVYLNDVLLLIMLYPLINETESVVVSSLKPHNSIKNIDLVKFLYINRNVFFRQSIPKYLDLIGPNTVMKYDVIKTINKFTEGKFSDDGLVIGNDLIKKNYRIYYINEYLGETFNYPPNLKSYIYQNLRWIENSFFSHLEENNKFFLVKFVMKFVISVYLLIFAFLFFLNYSLFLVGILIMFSSYLKKIRKIIFYEFTLSESLDFKLSILFYIKIIFYIYLEAFMSVNAFLEIVFFKKKYIRRKNLLSEK